MEEIKRYINREVSKLQKDVVNYSDTSRKTESVIRGMTTIDISPTTNTIFFRNIMSNESVRINTSTNTLLFPNGSITGVSDEGGDNGTIVLSQKYGSGINERIEDLEDIVQNISATELETTFVGRINGMNIPTITGGGSDYGGLTWPHLLNVKIDGVTELGRILDFHSASGQFSTDNTFRITNTSNGNLSFSGNVTISGTINSWNLPVHSNTYHNGRVWPHITGVNVYGAMEIGRYLDFHNTSNLQQDYSFRFDNTSDDNLIMSGNVTLSVGKNIIANNIKSDNETRLAGVISDFSNHNHDLLYSDINHNHDLLYSDINHNHDLLYSDINHNHDSLYSSSSHTHDSQYSDINHNHDSDYSDINHNHNSLYSDINHDHDEDYSDISHTHSNYETSISSNTTGISTINTWINNFTTTFSGLQGDVSTISGVVSNLVEKCFYIELPREDNLTKFTGNIEANNIPANLNTVLQGLDDKTINMTATLGNTSFTGIINVNGTDTSSGIKLVAKFLSSVGYDTRPSINIGRSDTLNLTIGWRNVSGSYAFFNLNNSADEMRLESTRLYLTGSLNVVANNIKADNETRLAGVISDLSSHNHDSQYSDINHNHDSQYSDINHNHDLLYSDINHNHDLLYSDINHTHSDYETSIDDLYEIEKNKGTGIINFPTITDNLDGSITMGSDGVVALTTAANGDSVYRRYSIPSMPLALTNQVTNYVFAMIHPTYGSIYSTTDQPAAFYFQANLCPVCRAIRDDNTVYILKYGDYGLLCAQKHLLSTVFLKGIQRQTGLVIEHVLTQYIKISAGYVWFASNFFPLAEALSSTGILRKYYLVNGIWDSTSGLTQFDINTYSDGSNELTMTNNRYSAKYFYLAAAYNTQAIFYVSGNQYTALLDAASEGIPPIPDMITQSAIYVGKIVFQKDAPLTITVYPRVWENDLTSGTVNSHNNLTGLQGGTVGQYYHLSQSKHDSINYWNFPSTSSYRLYPQLVGIRTDGVIEIGRIIDWHITQDDGADYTGRTQVDSSGNMIHNKNITATNIDANNKTNIQTALDRTMNMSATSGNTVFTGNVNITGENIISAYNIDGENKTNITNLLNDVSQINSNLSDINEDLSNINGFLTAHDERIGIVETRTQNMQSEFGVSNFTGNINATGETKSNGFDTNYNTTSQIGSNMRRALLDLFYPVGTIYQTRVENSGPVSIGGTWSRILGKVIIGAGSYWDGQESIGFEPGMTYGRYSHILSISELPNHSHTYTSPNYITESIRGVTDGNRTYSNGTSTSNSSYVGGGEPHNNIQPSYCVYIYQRTA